MGSTLKTRQKGQLVGVLLDLSVGQPSLMEPKRRKLELKIASHACIASLLARQTVWDVACRCRGPGAPIKAMPITLFLSCKCP